MAMINFTSSDPAKKMIAKHTIQITEGIKESNDYL
jgi:hypothetical protein